MFFHHELESAPFAEDFFHLALMLRRLYRYGAYDIEGVNCHVLAIVLAQCYEAYDVEHGGVWQSDRHSRHQHSWLVIKDTSWIIDLKPIHCVTLSPLLIKLGKDSVYGDIYQVHRNEHLMQSLANPNVKVASEHLLRVLQKIDQEEPVTEAEVQAVKRGYV